MKPEPNGLSLLFLRSYTHKGGSPGFKEDKNQREKKNRESCESIDFLRQIKEPLRVGEKYKNEKEENFYSQHCIVFTYTTSGGWTILRFHFFLYKSYLRTVLHTRLLVTVRQLHRILTYYFSKIRNPKKDMPSPESALRTNATA